MIEASSFATSSGTTEGTIARGAQLGKFEVIDKLAVGGMAEIFLARASGLLGFQKLVVIKRILPHLASRHDFIQMFLDEARIATTLSHPNVVQTHEVGVHGKSYFLVMEYLAGEDVRALLRRLGRDGTRMPVEHALDIGIGVAAGLHYAHEKRDFDGRPLEIVHRDVTPQNVIVSYDGGVKLLDFGIAKASNRINETRSGSFKGKVPYMSPEQCRGEKLDRRTDIFSLGILLYEMTLGRRLFRGPTDFQILKQIVDGAIALPTEIDPSYDPRLEAIVMKALDSDPARRYQTARELQEALEALSHELRLKRSQLALADFMQAMFADKAGEWQAAAAEGDVDRLEQHCHVVAAERERDLQAEEAEISSAPAMSSAPTEVGAPQLDVLPDEPAPRRSRAWTASLAITALVGGGIVAHRVWLHARAAPMAPVAAAAPGAPVVAAALVAPVMATPPVAPTPPPAGTVQVTTTPAGATLILDGETLTERSPARLSGLVAGEPHLLAVHLDGYQGIAQRFTLEAGEEASLELALRREPAAHHGAHSPSRAARASAHPTTEPAPGPAPAPAPAPAPKGPGALVIASSPWCSVTVDGKPRGSTPLKLELASGPHEVVLANPEFHIRRTLAVEIAAGQTLRKSLDFAPE